MTTSQYVVARIRKRGKWECNGNEKELTSERLHDPAWKVYRRKVKEVLG